MKLAQRLTLTMVAITVILIAPAIYGLLALRQLHQVAYDLRTRDAVGALALGRLQTAFRELDNQQRIFLAFAEQPEQRTGALVRVIDSLTNVDMELARLREGGYADVTAAAERAWAELRAAIEEEQRLIRTGQVAAADTHRRTVVDPAFRQMDQSLDPIGRAINLVGETRVQRAQAIAARAEITILLALFLALFVAVMIGVWTGRSLLVPVSELRRGMAGVAEGDFDQKLEISTERSDEIGELGRTFSLMAHDLAVLDRIKAEFVSIASHELKAPLNVIRGYVSLLGEGMYGPVTPEQGRVLGSVGDQTERLGRMIQELLDIGRFEAGGGRLDIEPVDVRILLDEFAPSFEALARQNEIEFEIVVDPGIPETIECDGDRLNEVVGNLLENAFKFTPRGGRIELRAAPAPNGDEGILIEVTDTGIGVPSEHLPRIFEKFYQVENEPQSRSMGTGLGLAISKEIVESHGGEIRAESQYGQGTTFRVLLPLHPPDESVTG